MAVLNEEALRLLADPARPPRASALMALSDADAAAVRLLQASWDKIPVERRRLIVRRLVEIAEDNVEADFHRVLRVFLDDADPDVRATAASGLWEDDSPVLLREFLALLSDDPSPLVREAAAEALAFFAMEAALGDPGQEQGNTLRLALLAAFARSGEDPKVRGAALQSVAVYEDEEVRAAIEMAYRSPEASLRANALAAMGNNLNSCFEPVVLLELKSLDPVMRYEAAKAAGFMELGQAVPRLIELSHDPDADVRMGSITALGQIGGQAARKCLRTLVKSSDRAVSEQASAALEEMAFMEDPLDGLPPDIELGPLERAQRC
jgi:HEAT repeat protein